MEVLDQYYESPAWIEPTLGVLFIIIMGLFVYMSSHLISERKAGKQLPMFWEKKEKEMGYKGMYKKSAPKKATKAKKPAVKKKKVKKSSKY